METPILETEPAGVRATPPPQPRGGNPVGGPPAYAAELLGTLMLVLFIVLVLSIAAPAPDGFGVLDFAVIGLVHAFVLMLLVASLGGVSGAHFNPAVTIALLAKRKIGGGDAAIYIACQLVGAILGALIGKALISDAADAMNVGATTISEGRFLDGAVGKAMIAEFIGTFALMWAIMAMAVNPRADRSWAPFVIGAALGLGAMTIAPLTGAGFNPARSFGPALIANEFGGAGDFLLAYVLAPVLGAVAAALAYTAIVLAPEQRGEMRPVDKLD